jgi:hypothetical protein
MAQVIVKGKITDIKDAQIFGMVEVRSMFVKETDGRYPQEYEIKFFQGKGNMLDSYNIGDEVTVTTELQSKKYTKNNYTNHMLNLSGWKIERIAAPVRKPAPEPKKLDPEEEARRSYEQQVKSQVPQLPAGTDIDDLPF